PSSAPDRPRCRTPRGTASRPPTPQFRVRGPDFDVRAALTGGAIASVPVRLTTIPVLAEARPRTHQSERYYRRCKGPILITPGSHSTERTQALKRRIRPEVVE